MPLFFIYAYLRLYISCFCVALEYVSKIYYNRTDFIVIFAPVFFVYRLREIICVVFVNQ